METFDFLSNLATDLTFSGDVTLTGQSISVSPETLTLNPGDAATVVYTISGTPNISAGLNYQVDWTNSDLVCSDSGVATNPTSGLGTFDITGESIILLPASRHNNSNSFIVRALIDNTANVRTVQIPYTVTAVGPYATVEHTIKTSLPGTGAGNSGGDIENFTLRIPSGEFLTMGASGFLTGTVVVSSNAGGDNNEIFDVNPVDTDVTDGNTINTADIVVFDDFPGSSTTVTAQSGDVIVRATSVVYDRRYLQSSIHRFVYYPVTAADGTTWLGTNLGAEYGNINNIAAFDPLAQATSEIDELAYGALFQWGRDADGHQLITYIGSANATGTIVGLVTGPIAYDETLSTVSKTPLFANAVDTDWRIPTSGTVGTYAASDQDLWGNASNNPCPVGYHVPTYSELYFGLFNNDPSVDDNTGYDLNTMAERPVNDFSVTGDDGRSAINTALKLPYAPERTGEAGVFLRIGDPESSYWVSDRFDFESLGGPAPGVVPEINRITSQIVQDDEALVMRLRFAAQPRRRVKSFAYPVRCKKD